MSLRVPAPFAAGTYKLALTNNRQKLSPMLHGYYVNSTYGTAIYLMAFDATTEPANGTAPLFGSIYVDANAKNVSIAYPLGQLIGTVGLLLVASTTPGTLTKDASATLYITADVEEWESQPVPLTASTAGDLTTGVNGLTVWNDAAGPKRLKRLEVINTVAAVRYLTIYAVDSPDATSKRVFQKKVAASARLEIDFGPDGLQPYQLDSDQTTVHDACQIKWQTVADAGGAVSADANIKAYYTTN